MIREGRMPATMTKEVTIVNTHNLKAILLSSGWVNVKDCEVIPYSVGSSPQSDYQTGLKFSDELGKTHIVKLAAVQAYRGDFEI